MLPSNRDAERFRRDFEALAGAPARLGVAVSGGPDSVALLLLAAAAFPGRVQAATVDHGLRSESRLEALHVEDVCARIGCPHSILDVAVADGPAGLQAEARAARYSALLRWGQAQGISHLATAHHVDDQAETVLMRLQRGSGIAGIAAIRPLRREQGLTVVRPLLGWSKSELVHIVGQAGLAFIEDPSNADPRFDRAAIRAFLRGNPQFEPRRLARTAAAAREADEALAWTIERLWNERSTQAEDCISIDPADLPRDLRRRLLSRAVGALSAGWTVGQDVEGLLAALEAGESATRAEIVASGGPVWRIRKAPPRRQTKDRHE